MHRAGAGEGMGSFVSTDRLSEHDEAFKNHVTTIFIHDTMRSTAPPVAAEDEHSALRESVDDLIERIRAYAEKYGTHHDAHPMYPATFYDLVDAERSGKLRRQLHVPGPGPGAGPVPVPNAHAPEREFDDIARLFGAALLPSSDGPKKMTVEEYDAFKARVLRYATNRLPEMIECDIMKRHGFFPDYDIVYAIQSELPRKYVTGLYKGETEAEPGKIPEIPDDDARVFKGHPDAVDFTNFPTAGVRVGDDMVKRLDAMDAADRVPETPPRASPPPPPEAIADRTFFMERTRMGYIPGPASPPVRVTDDIEKEFVRLDVANLVPDAPADAPVPTDAPDAPKVPDHAPTTAYERIVSENTVLTDAAIDAIKRALDAVRNAPPTVPVVPAPTTESHVNVDDHAKEFVRFVRERDVPVGAPVDTTTKIDATSDRAYAAKDAKAAFESIIVKFKMMAYDRSKPWSEVEYKVLDHSIEKYAETAPRHADDEKAILRKYALSTDFDVVSMRTSGRLRDIFDIRTDIVPDAIVAAAVAARVHADPRLTGFRVGAAVMTSTGKIFTGSNAEIPSGQILHAETFALGAARSAGHRDIVAMCVASECETCTPCGQCREWIRSAMPPDAPVYVHNNLDGRTTTMFVKDLLADPPVLNLTPTP